jgi:hypothetical protein
LIDEQVRFGVLAVSEEIAGTGNPVPGFLNTSITALGFQMLGVDLEKLDAEQQKKLRQSEERRRLIEGGFCVKMRRSPRVQHVSAGTVKKLSMH